MKEITLPASGEVSLEVIGGINNAASYAVALWNPKTQKYEKVGEGLASSAKPDGTSWKLGDAGDIRGKTLLVRAYVLPYQANTPPYFVGAIVSAPKMSDEKIGDPLNSDVTVNILAKLA